MLLLFQVDFYFAPEVKLVFYWQQQQQQQQLKIRSGRARQGWLLLGQLWQLGLAAAAATKAAWRGWVR